MTSDLKQAVPFARTSVRDARRMMADFGTSAGLSTERVQDLSLAVSEAVTNCIRHGCVGDEDVVITARHAAGQIWITISDSGPRAQGPDRDPGLGMGLSIMRQVADDVEVDIAEGGTTVKLMFRTH